MLIAETSRADLLLWLTLLLGIAVIFLIVVALDLRERLRDARQGWANAERALRERPSKPITFTLDEIAADLPAQWSWPAPPEDAPRGDG